MYVPADSKLAERCMPETHQPKKPKLFDTTAQRKRAMPQPVQLPLASPTPHTDEPGLLSVPE